MAYEMLQSGNTPFAIDWDIVRRLLRSYWTARLQYDYGEEVSISDSHWYNPMTWALPEVSHVEVNWDRVRQDALENTKQELESMRIRAKYGAASVARELEARIEEAARYRDTFVDWMGDVQTQNMHRIDRSVDAYESAVDVAKFIRDMSADGLMIGASVMSGGAALAAVGGGSIFKGTCKFQDTGSLGAGAMEAAGSFAFAYVKLGKKFSFKQDMVLALVQAPWKAGTELVGGASLGKAVLSGALKLTGPSVEKLFKVGPGKMLFDKVAVPVVISYGGNNVASTVLSKFAAKGIQGQGVEKWGKGKLLGSAKAPEPPAPPARPAKLRVFDDVTLTTKHLLYIAYVNMNYGIGRGW